METSDYQVINQALQWLKKQQTVFLVTVLKTWGSSPRPVGSLLAISGQHHIGSVSGGCIEADLIEKLQQAQTKSCFYLNYGVENSASFGLPCGGELILGIEKLSNISELESIINPLRQRQVITRTVNFECYQTQTCPSITTDKTQWQLPIFTKVFGPRWHMFIIGANQIAYYLAQMAPSLDYDITLCDPRSNYINDWHYPNINLSTMMPDEWIEQNIIDHRHAVIAVSHDPKLDDRALWQALESPAFYIGALGSKSSQQQRYQRLQALGLSDTDLAKLHAPIGLAISSHTPAEIAIAILAELVMVKKQIMG